MAVQDVAVGFAQGVGDHLVADEAPVLTNTYWASLASGGAGRVDGQPGRFQEELPARGLRPGGRRRGKSSPGCRRCAGRSAGTSC